MCPQNLASGVGLLKFSGTVLVTWWRKGSPSDLSICGPVHDMFLRNQFSLYVLLSYSVNERLSKLQGLADDRVDVPALPSG